MIQCINNPNDIFFITINKYYDPIKYEQGDNGYEVVWILDDNGNITPYNVNKFKHTDEIRDNIIDNLI